MAMDMQTVLYRISAEIIRLDGQRVKEGLSVEFQNLREAMIGVHCAIQDFMAVIRGSHEPLQAVEVAILASAAFAKLACDLGESRATAYPDKRRGSKVHGPVSLDVEGRVDEEDGE